MLTYFLSTEQYQESFLLAHEHKETF